MTAIGTSAMATSSERATAEMSRPIACPRDRERSQVSHWRAISPSGPHQIRTIANRSVACDHADDREDQELRGEVSRHAKVEIPLAVEDHTLLHQLFRCRVAPEPEARHCQQQKQIQ